MPLKELENEPGTTFVNFMSKLIMEEVDTHESSKLHKQVKFKEEDG